MTNTTIAFHLQKRVGYASSLTTFAIATTNLLIGVFKYQMSVGSVVQDSSVWLLYFFALIGTCTSFVDSKVARFIHVALFIGTSIATTVVLEVGSLHGVLFFVFGSLLALQYGFFRTHFWVKVTILVTIYLGAIVVSVVFQAGYSLPSGLPPLSLTAMMVYLFWAIFSEEIKEIRSHSTYLQQELDRNRIFVNFGHDVVGVVHNLRSALMSVEGYNDIMKNAANEEHPEYLSLQSEATGRMIDMVENFMVAVRSYQRIDQEVVNLSNIVHSAVELVQGNQEIKHDTCIDCRIPPDLLAFVSPLELMQVLDNLIVNAHDSLAGRSTRMISIEGRSEPSFAIIEITDSGDGIAWCKSCDRDDCLNCHEFRIGKTTKENGTGVGFAYVREIIKKSNGDLRVQSPNGQDGGTKITLRLPREPAIA